jgi:glycosyltransferase involved in cell wall biosynthesis
VLTHHNVESALLRRRADGEGSPVLNAYLRMQARWMEAAERLWCPRAAMNVAVSLADRRALERLAPGARFTVLPNGVDTSVFQPGIGVQRGVVFVGGYDWFPNRDSMEYFSEQILPRIRSHMPLEVTWVGRAPEAVQRAFLQNHGIAMTGYRDDIRPHVQRAACYVVPLRVGGGTRLKILDAWAMGKAIVSTSIGCEGLDARDGENILVRDDPESFAGAVRAVLADADLRRRLGENARATAERVYDWEVIGAEMLRDYHALLEG